MYAGRVCARTQRTGAAARESLGEIALSGLRRLHSTLAAVPVLFAHAVVTAAKNRTSATPNTTGYLSVNPMAQCVVHALKGLACRARVTPASSPTALQAELSAHVAFAPRARLRQAFSHKLRSQKTYYLFQWVQKT